MLLKLYQKYFYHYDGNGNVVAMTNTSGTIVAEYTYDAYGNLTAMSGSEAAANPIRFSTKYFDGDTGYYDFGFRSYDPVTGRWLNRDPIGEDGGLNLYGFVGNSPGNVWDAYGMDWVDAFAAVRKTSGAILKISSSYGLQPELLAGVVWVEAFAGGLPGGAQANDQISYGKFLFNKSASLGITSYTLNPKNIRGCETFLGRKKWADRYLNDIDRQLRNGASLLKYLVMRPNRYPKEWNKLNRWQMSIILTEYNRPPTNSSREDARPSKYGRRFLIDIDKIRTALYGGKK